MKKLLSFYHYVFYWGYQQSLRTDQAGEWSAFVGLMHLCSFLCLNLLALAIATEWLLHVRFLPVDVPKWKLAAVVFVLVIPHYYYLLHSGRFRPLTAKFNKLDQDQRWYANRRVILYMVGSVLVLGLAAYLRKNYPNPLHL